MESNEASKTSKNRKIIRFNDLSSFPVFSQTVNSSPSFLLVLPNSDNFGPDLVANKNSQKRQTKRQEKSENHAKIPDTQIVEPGLIVDKLVDCEVDAIFFVENQKELHSQTF